MATQPMRIDIVSDVVCPWCIIGYKQLEAALEITNTAANIQWHPFELNPAMPAEGENLRQHLAAKYGTTREESVKARARLTEIGSELGFQFNYADDMRMVNTFRAHQLLHWAGQSGLMHNLKMALFEAFFTYRRDINDPDVLVEIAGEIGLDKQRAKQVLAGETYARSVRDEEQSWISKGISGVPAMIFDQTHLVSGAQGTENYVAILRHILTNRAA